jgi:hypothetical protein
MSLYTRRDRAEDLRLDLALDLQRLQRELGQQRRRELAYGQDPLDAAYLQRAHRNALATTIAAEECPDGEGADDATVARMLDREVEKGLGDLFLEVVAAEAEARSVESRLLAAPRLADPVAEREAREADTQTELPCGDEAILSLERRLLAARTRVKGKRKVEPDELAALALFAKPQEYTLYGDQRPRAIRRLGGHLLAVGVRPGVALGLLESWDRTHNSPALEPLGVERELRWVARKQAQQLRGVA